METKVLNEYTIDFYSKDEWILFLNKLGYLFIPYESLAINEYAGLVSEISEELAEKIVDKITLPFDYTFYKHYKTNNCDRLLVKQSFQTLSDLPYCVITKNEK